MTDVELDRGLLVPSGIFTLQKMAEEALLQRHTVIRVKMGPVRVAMGFKPFPVRCGREITLEITPNMQTLPAPIGGGQKRHGNLGQLRRPLCEVFGNQFPVQTPALNIDPVFRQFRLAQGFGPGYQLAGGKALMPAFAAPVLSAMECAWIQVFGKLRIDPSVPDLFAIKIQTALPNATGVKMGRSKACGMLLVHRVV